MVHPPAGQPLTQITHWAFRRRESLVHWKQVVHHAGLAKPVAAAERKQGRSGQKDRALTATLWDHVYHPQSLAHSFPLPNAWVRPPSHERTGPARVFSEIAPLCLQKNPLQAHCSTQALLVSNRFSRMILEKNTLVSVNDQVSVWQRGLLAL